MDVVLLRIFAIVVALFGGAMLLGGFWLITLGGSWYYALAGLAMLVAGILMAQRRILGAWIYFVVFLLSAVWAIGEVGFEPWLLMPRLLALAVFVVLTALFIPVLRKPTSRPKQSGV